jgi:hypothetical protein
MLRWLWNSALRDGVRALSDRLKFWNFELLGTHAPLFRHGLCDLDLIENDRGLRSPISTSISGDPSNSFLCDILIVIVFLDEFQILRIHRPPLLLDPL